MNRITTLLSAGALSLVLAAPASSQTAGAQARGAASGEAQAPPAQASAQAQAQAQAQADLEARERMEAVREKGARTSAEARAKAESKLEAAAQKADAEASARGEATVAGRLAAEFGMTAEELMAQRQELGCSWGQLMIAHSLLANAATELTIEQLMELNGSGAGWGQIAAGLGLRLGDAVSAVQAESRVAAGLAKPDGKVAVIRGEGARASVRADAGARASVPSTGAASVQAGAGVGVKIKP